VKRRAEHLVLKRDGRREFLRATKLARSIHLALHSVGVDEDWRALELANVVLQALRQKRRPTDEAPDQVVLTTAEIGDAVQHLLVVTGQPAAAVAFGAVAAERTRRRQVVATMARSSGLEAPLVAPGIGARGRLPQE
jgi:transcriptional regulator NrdR family protein